MKFITNLSFVYMILVSLASRESAAFSLPTTQSKNRLESCSMETTTSTTISRRHWMTQGLTTFARTAIIGTVGGSTVASLSSSPVYADTGAEVRGTAITPFNSLIFNYRGNDFGGLQASDLNEPSISYQDFMKRLQAGDIEFVEFMAPNGDIAYATLKGENKSIRIGEGYPIEQADGWSSPAFVIRTVQNAGVPYQFTVPALRMKSKK